MTNQSSNNKISHEASRRGFLKQLTAAIGATAAYPLLSGDNLAIALAYYDKKTLINKAPVLFSKAQLDTLASVCQTVIPRTDTFGAADVNCHGFIDNQLVHCHTKTEQQNSVAIVKKIETLSQQHFASSFHLLDSKQQTLLLTDLENNVHFTLEDSEQFKTLKSLIVFGYFTSEVGATEALNYQAVPGGYKASIPYDQNSKAWGSFGFY